MKYLALFIVTITALAATYQPYKPGHKPIEYLDKRYYVRGLSNIANKVIVESIARSDADNEIYRYIDNILVTSVNDNAVAISTNLANTYTDLATNKVYLDSIHYTDSHSMNATLTMGERLLWVSEDLTLTNYITTTPTQYIIHVQDNNFVIKH